MPKLTKQTRKVLEMIRDKSLEEQRSARSAEQYAEHFKTLKDSELEKKWRKVEKHHDSRGLFLRILEIDLEEEHGLTL